MSSDSVMQQFKVRKRRSGQMATTPTPKKIDVDDSKQFANSFGSPNSFNTGREIIWDDSTPRRKDYLKRRANVADEASAILQFFPEEPMDQKSDCSAAVCALLQTAVVPPSTQGSSGTTNTKRNETEDKKESSSELNEALFHLMERVKQQKARYNLRSTGFNKSPKSESNNRSPIIRREPSNIVLKDNSMHYNLRSTGSNKSPKSENNRSPVLKCDPSNIVLKDNISSKSINKPDPKSKTADLFFRDSDDEIELMMMSCVKNEVPSSVKATTSNAITPSKMNTVNKSVARQQETQLHNTPKSNLMATKPSDKSSETVPSNLKDEIEKKKQLAIMKRKIKYEQSASEMIVPAVSTPLILASQDMGNSKMEEDKTLLMKAIIQKNREAALMKLREKQSQSVVAANNNSNYSSQIFSSQMMNFTQHVANITATTTKEEIQRKKEEAILRRKEKMQNLSVNSQSSHEFIKPKMKTEPVLGKVDTLNKVEMMPTKSSQNYCLSTQDNMIGKKEAALKLRNDKLHEKNSQRNNDFGNKILPVPVPVKVDAINNVEIKPVITSSSQNNCSSNPGDWIRKREVALKLRNEKLLERSSQQRSNDFSNIDRILFESVKVKENTFNNIEIKPVITGSSQNNCMSNSGDWIHKREAALKLRNENLFEKNNQRNNDFNNRVWSNCNANFDSSTPVKRVIQSVARMPLSRSTKSKYEMPLRVFSNII